MSADPVTSANPHQLNENELRAVVDGLRDCGVIVLDADGRIRLWANAAESLFGYSQADIINQDVAMLFMPEDRARGIDREEMLQARTSGRAADEHLHVRKDGTRFFATGVLTPLRSASGEVTGYVKLICDVSPAHESQEANGNVLRSSSRRAVAIACVSGESTAGPPVDGR